MTNLLIVFDIDGTLSDPTHRMHHIKPDPTHDPVTGKKRQRRFDLFHTSCGADGLIGPVANIYNRMVADPTVTVVLLTGRPDSVRQTTTDWLTQHGLDGYDALFMKTGDQNVPDVQQKAAIADQVEETYGRPIDMVFEDRTRVVKMWKARGTFVLNVLQDDED